MTKYLHTPQRKYLAALALLAAPLLLAAYPRYVAANSTSAGIAPPPLKEQASPGQHAYGNAGSYLAARYARDKGDSEAASYYYSYSLGHSPYNESLMKQAVRTHILAGRMEDAAQVARNLTTLYDGTQLAHLILLIDNLGKGDITQARAHLDKTDPYGLFSVIQPILQAWVALAETGKPAEIPVSEHIRKLQVFDQLLAFQNALLFDVGGDTVKAETFYSQVAQDMTGLNYRDLLAMLDFYRRQGEMAKVDTLFAQYLAQNRTNQLIEGMDVRQALADAKRKDGKPYVAEVKDGVAEAMFSMAGMLYGENVTAETQLYLQLALHLKPDMADGLLMLGNITEDRGNATKAIAYYDKLPKGGPVYRRAHVRKAFLLSTQDRMDEAMTLLSDLQRAHPKSADVLVAQGDLYRKLMDFHNAARVYSRALELSEGGPQEYHWPILFARGISFERDGEWDKAEADFRKALELYPDQPDVLNYLGYSWLMQGTNLDKAKEMLEQAVAERPEDAHIIDSMGWALYMLRDYDGALEYLEQAVNLMPNDPVVNDHYGDALWQVGRRNEARFQWERALYFGPAENDREKIEAKLRDGLLTKEPPRISAARN